MLLWLTSNINCLLLVAIWLWISLRTPKLRLQVLGAVINMPLVILISVHINVVANSFNNGTKLPFSRFEQTGMMFTVLAFAIASVFLAVHLKGADRRFWTCFACIMATTTLALRFYLVPDPFIAGAHTVSSAVSMVAFFLFCVYYAKQKVKV